MAKTKKDADVVRREREAAWPWQPVEIRSLSDVEPEAASTEAYMLRRSLGGRLVSVDYAWASSQTHQTRLIRECRGMLFDGGTGGIAARPLHKFFNEGERPEDDAAVDWTEAHRICEKLDGSLFYPAVVGGDGGAEVVWCTRGGDTEKSREGIGEAPEGMLDAVGATMLEHDGVRTTPSFEYVSPSNRVVVLYDEPRIVLLAVRENVSGRYLRPEEVDGMVADAERVWGHPIPRAKEVWATGAWCEPGDREQAIGQLRQQEEGEGVVVAFDSGYRIKIKTDRYIAIHRVVAGLGHESHVLQAVLKGQVDDWTARLPEEDADAVLRYAEQVELKIVEMGEMLGDEVARLNEQHAERGDFARAWMQGIGRDPVMRPAGFEVLDRVTKEGKDARTEAPGVLRSHVARRAGKQERIERELAQGMLQIPRWTPRGPEAPSGPAK